MLDLSFLTTEIAHQIFAPVRLELNATKSKKWLVDFKYSEVETVVKHTLLILYERGLLKEGPE